VGIPESARFIRVKRFFPKQNPLFRDFVRVRARELPSERPNTQSSDPDLRPEGDPLVGLQSGEDECNSVERSNLDCLPARPLKRAHDGCAPSRDQHRRLSAKGGRRGGRTHRASSSLGFDAPYHESACRIMRSTTTLPQILLDNVFRTLIPANRSVPNLEALVTFGPSGKEGQEMG
jgi:hypothetical protein